MRFHGKIFLSLRLTTLEAWIQLAPRPLEPSFVHTLETSWTVGVNVTAEGAISLEDRCYQGKIVARHGEPYNTPEST